MILKLRNRCRIPDITKTEESITWEMQTDELLLNKTPHGKKGMHEVRGLDSTITKYCGLAFDLGKQDLFFL
jgi:hypothetical protein